MGHQFRGVLMKIVNFEKFGIFGKSQFFLETTFFVKYNTRHFTMSFLIVRTSYHVYKTYTMLTVDEYRYYLAKMWWLFDEVNKLLLCLKDLMML